MNDIPDLHTWCAATDLVLDEERAATLGDQLRAFRHIYDKTQFDVARVLSLSRAQVDDLESGRCRSFYSIPFYCRGLRRYVVLAGIALSEWPVMRKPAGVTTPSEEPAFFARLRRLLKA